MHMLSKKDLSSAALDTLRKSRNPTTVITANLEVQTSEEAQVYVHDPELFMTVQIFDDTAAVLSSGSRSAEKTRLYLRVDQWSKATSDGKIILCSTENVVLVVVEGLSSSSSSSSSSASSPQDLSSTSASPARLRSDDIHDEASGNRGDPRAVKRTYNMFRQ